jgi:hypothetical protein
LPRYNRNTRYAKKAAQQSADWTLGILPHYGKHFAQRGFGFFLLPSRVHARPSAMLRERKSLGAGSEIANKIFSESGSQKIKAPNIITFLIWSWFTRRRRIWRLEKHFSNN